MPYTALPLLNMTMAVLGVAACPPAQDQPAVKKNDPPVLTIDGEVSLKTALGYCARSIGAKIRFEAAEKALNEAPGFRFESRKLVGRLAIEDFMSSIANQRNFYLVVLDEQKNSFDLIDARGARRPEVLNLAESYTVAAVRARPNLFRFVRVVVPIKHADTKSVRAALEKSTVWTMNIVQEVEKDERGVALVITGMCATLCRILPTIEAMDAAAANAIEQRPRQTLDNDALEKLLDRMKRIEMALKQLEKGLSSKQRK